jgi:DNA-binding GntR family transcriptional regulator
VTDRDNDPRQRWDAERAGPDAWLQSVTASDAAASTHADRVFDAIEAALISGEIPLGSRLGEEALSRRLGVSRGTLREALRRLEGRGLVERLPHAGVRVVQLSQTDLIELYEMREPLEGMACRLAAQRMSDEEIRHLRTLLLQHRAAEKSPEAAHGLLDFHFLIAKASRSRRLEKLLSQDLYSLIRLCRLRIAQRAPRVARAGDEHRRILDAIEDRDAELAELLMRRHIATARRHLEQQYAEDKLS